MALNRDNYVKYWRGCGDCFWNSYVQ